MNTDKAYRCLQSSQRDVFSGACISKLKELALPQPSYMIFSQECRTVNNNEICKVYKQAIRGHAGDMHRITSASISMKNDAVILSRCPECPTADKFLLEQHMTKCCVLMETIADQWFQYWRSSMSSNRAIIQENQSIVGVPYQPLDNIIIELMIVYDSVGAIYSKTVAAFNVIVSRAGVMGDLIEFTESYQVIPQIGCIH